MYYHLKLFLNFNQISAVSIIKVQNIKKKLLNQNMVTRNHHPANHTTLAVFNTIFNGADAIELSISLTFCFSE